MIPDIGIASAGVGKCVIDDGTGQIRTGDLALRRRSLYPAELQPQLRSIYNDSSSFSWTAKNCAKNRHQFLTHKDSCELGE